MPPIAITVSSLGIETPVNGQKTKKNRVAEGGNDRTQQTVGNQKVRWLS